MKIHRTLIGGVAALVPRGVAGVRSGARRGPGGPDRQGQQLSLHDSHIQRGGRRDRRRGPQLQERVGHRREPVGAVVGQQQRHEHLDALQGRRDDPAPRRERSGRADRHRLQRRRVVPVRREHAGGLPLRRRGRQHLRVGRRHRRDGRPRAGGGIDLQGPGDPRRRGLHDRLRTLRGRGVPGRLLQPDVRRVRHGRRVRRWQHPRGLLPVRHPGGRRLHLRDVRVEGGRGRRGGTGPWLRAPVRHRRQPRGGGRIARPAELSLGHGDGAGRGLRQVQRLPAGRQLRRRAHQRVLPEQRRAVASRRQAQGGRALADDRRALGHRLRQRRSGRTEDHVCTSRPGPTTRRTVTTERWSSSRSRNDTASFAGAEAVPTPNKKGGHGGRPSSVRARSERSRARSCPPPPASDRTARRSR